MAGLTVGDDPEWEDIKKDFVNSEVSSRRRIIAIQRLTKEYAVGMDNAEAIADRWGRECRDEALKAREKITIGDALKECSKRKNDKIREEL
jgi:hypothetical protein